MPSSNSHGSPMSFVSFRRSILSTRSDEVHSVEVNEDFNAQNAELESFQKQVFSQFHDLSVAKDDEFLSISWVQKLLDAFTSCQEEFQVILSKNRGQFSKPPLDKIVSELFDRSIKALDICNATRDGIEKIRQWQKHLEIVLCALDSQQRMMGEGQFRRARKALMDLALVMLDEKDTGSVFSRRNRSFGRHFKSKDPHHHQSRHSRSLSWSVSHSWSAAKQLQSIANNLVPPRGNEVAATNGFAIFVYTMSFVQMFVLWTLVATIPCQDRSLQIQFAIPRQFLWSTPLYLLHNRIMDEAKKHDRQNSSGLLKEIYLLEKRVHRVTDLVDSAQFPLPEEQKEEVRDAGKELSSVCEVFKTGLDPLERQLREVFRKIMSCRTEGLGFLGSASQP